MDEKIIAAYEILCLSVLRCTKRRHGVEKTDMPDALALLNMNNARHLEHLVWAVYDGALLVGGWPELPGNCPWSTVLAGLYKHIYRGHEDMAHCPPHTLASWDCQERIEVLRRRGRLSSTWGGQRRASRPRRRSRSSSRCCSQTLAQGDRNRHSCSPSPCMPLRCHCGATLYPNANTMPKLALAVNILSYARSSHSGGGVAQASLDDEDTWEDEFQTTHTPVRCVVWGEDGGRGELVDGRMDTSRASPGWRLCYQVDIGDKEAMLESIDPTWRPTHWLQQAVQGISDDEVPWYELVTPLTVGAEGAALSLAKHLLTVWRWSIKVLGEDVCPPSLTALNIGQFMTREEVLEGVGEPHWFVAYSRALQQVGEATCKWKWEWPARETLEVKVSPLVHAFWEETGTDLTVACIKLCWEPTPRGIFRKREEGPVAHVITFMDELAIRVPSLDAWDQFVWLPAAAMLRALTSRAIWLLPWPGCRPQVCHAGGTIQSDR